MIYFTKLNHFLRVVVFLLLVLLFSSPACHNQSEPLENSSSAEFTKDQIKTLESLKKVDDYPLYVMTYYGDYGRHEYFWTDNTTDENYYKAENHLTQKSHWSCTCFAALGKADGKIFGRNFDFYHRPAVLIYTDPPQGYASVSMVDIYYCGYEVDTPLETLTDRRGLLQAPLYPFDGINEKGVAIGLMAVPSAQPPFDPTKKTIYDLDVLRLVLDYARDTDEAISLIKKFNVQLGGIKLHFLIADKAGNSAIVEFVNHEMMIIKNQFPCQVSTNFVINNVLSNPKGYCSRYDTALQYLEIAKGTITAAEGLTILKDVSQSTTMWSLVYNMNSGDISAVMGRKYDVVHSFHLNMD